MAQFIGSAREHHLVSSEEMYRQRHLQVMTRKQEKGSREEVFNSGQKVLAYINHGAWCADCPCGAGLSGDPEWRHGRCFGCGAVHEIVFPDNYKQLEAALVVRPKRANRNWNLNETLDVLIAENIEHGILNPSGKVG